MSKNITFNIHKTTTKYLQCFLVVLFFFSLPFLTSAQSNPIIDSLRQLISNAPKDSNAVILLTDLAWELKFDAPGEARTILDSALVLSQQLNFKKGEGQIFNFKGVIEAIHDNYDEAIDYYRRALSIRKALGDQKGVASLYNNIGNLYESLDKYHLALDNLRHSLKIREELKDTLRIARASANIGMVYEARGDYPEALDYIFNYLVLSETLNEDSEIANAHNILGNIKAELERFEEALDHYQKSLKIRESLGEEWERASVYNNMGNIMDDLGERNYKANDFEIALTQFEEALDYHRRALDIRLKLKDKEGEADSYNNMGLVYKNLGSYYEELQQKQQSTKNLNTALTYLNKAFNIQKELDNKKGLIEIYNGIGDVKRRQKKYKAALQNTTKYLALAKEIEDQKYIQSAYKDLSKVYAKLNQFEKAFEFRKNYDELRYQRLDEKRTTDNARREALYTDTKKQFEIERLQKDAQLEASKRIAEQQQEVLYRNMLLIAMSFFLLLAGLLYNRNRIKTRANNELASKNLIIEKERKRSDDLLLNILPKETAEELKSFGKAKAKHHQTVTVLFTDIKGFTQIAEKLSPDQLVAELDECFCAFDEITERHGIEKIKTIGDAYMCAAGLSGDGQAAAIAIINAAKEMLAFVQQKRKERATQNKSFFEIRVGVHTGSVVSGIVGSKKFAYDIWGDTVNLAARMESKSEVGKINISKTTYEQVKDSFHCQFRGKILAKNKGEVEMYFVES